MWRGRREGPNTNTSTSTEVLTGDFEDFLRMEGGTNEARKGFLFRRRCNTSLETETRGGTAVKSKAGGSVATMRGRFD